MKNKREMPNTARKIILNKVEQHCDGGLPYWNFNTPIGVEL